MEPVKQEVMDKDGAYGMGKRLLGEWLGKAEGSWTKHGTGGMTLRDRWNYGRAIANQLPAGHIRVLLAASGTQPAAVKLVGDESGIAEHKLYWTAVKAKPEANYLCAILNSETARAAAEHWQSEGQWGKRDFDKAVFNLPIPLYDSKNALHCDLAAAAERAEALAAKVELKEAEHFTRTRARIRKALIDHGIAGKIEAMVARLIGVAPAASIAGGDEADTDAD
jgi:hypothetical protein